MNDILVHAFSCKGNCSHPTLANTCGTIRQTIEHLEGCEKADCDICMRMNQMIHQHSLKCTLDMCPVPNCNSLRDVAALHQLLSQPKSGVQDHNKSKEVLTCPKTPERKPKESFIFMTPVKSALKCMKCQCSMTENHVCSQSPGAFPLSPSTPVTGKFLLSPLRKRSFDAWSETQSDATSPGYSQQDTTGLYPGEESPALKLFLGEDDHEIITLPINLRSPNKVPKLDRKKMKGSQRKFPKWSSFSFQKAFMKNNKPKGHVAECLKKSTAEEGTNTPPLNPPSRSNSWGGFTNKEWFPAIKEEEKKPTFQKPPPIITSTTSTASLTATTSMQPNPLFERSNSAYTDTSEASMITDQELYMLLVSPKARVAILPTSSEIIPVVEKIDSDEDLSDIDLGGITLGCPENEEEWQKLMIYTPTSRNRPEIRKYKPVIVKETVFEEKEEGIVEAMSITPRNAILLQPVVVPSTACNAPVVSSEDIILYEMTKFTEELHVTDEEEEEVFRYLNCASSSLLDPTL